MVSINAEFLDWKYTQEIPTLPNDLKLLIAILQQRTSWTDLSAETQKSLVHLAIEQQVFPSLFKAAGSPAEYSPIARQFKLRSLWYLHHIHEVNNILLENNISVLWMKGAALANLVYDELWMRSMRDIDCIVPMNQRMQALSVLVQKGYNHKELLLGKHTVRSEIAHYVRHHFNLERGNVELELHYDLWVTQYLDLTSDDLAILWERPLTVILPNNQRLKTFNIELQIVTAAIHDVLQHQRRDSKSFMLYRTLDLYQIITNCEVDWEAVAAYAERMHCQGYVLQALYQAKQVLGLPFDINEIAHLFPNKNATHYGVYSITMNAVNSAKKVLPASKFINYVWELFFFPSRESMRQNFQIKPDQPVWPFYIKRIVNHVPLILWFVGSWLNQKLRRTTQAVSGSK